MRKKHVLFRVDGDTQIGLGHLVRCIALAQMLKDDYNITFFCKKIPDSIEQEIQNIGFGIKRIVNESDLLNVIILNNIVILDGYHFDSNLQKEIKATGAKLVCIDDLHDKEFVADLIINHSPGVKPSDYKAQPYTQFALGLEYALLRPAFLEQAKKQRKIERIETLMICFGGSDPKGFTQRVLEVVVGFSKFQKIIVVTGSVYQITDEFKQLIIKDDRIQHRHALNEQQMVATMLESDLAIVPASGILFEILAIGCKVISGKYIDNQAFLYKNLKMLGFFVDADDFSKNKLKDAIAKANKSFICKTKTIDGRTAIRVSKLFKQLNEECLIKLRRATILDQELTLNWATNPEIRRFSFQQHQITKQEHTNWFLKKIADLNSYFFIVEYNCIPIGSIRFDINSGNASISYLLDPAYHGQGYGLIILKKGIELLMIINAHDLTPIHVISGDVLKSNIPSIKAFDRLGFIKKDQLDNYKFEKWV